jgi:type II secretory pathway pseudopilin PulG
MSQIPPPYGAAAVPKKSNSVVWIVLLVLGGVFFFVMLPIIGILVALLLPAVQAAREAARMAADTNNARQVALAMYNYESALRVMPAPFSTNSDGVKTLSWKVAILPYLEENSLYKQIEGKTWDDPSVPGLQGPCPNTFRSTRSANSPTSNESNIFLIASPEEKESGNTFFIDGQYPKFSDCTDGTSSTIFAVMLAKHSRPWASPENLTPEEAFQLIQNEEREAIVIFLDGSVRRISKNIDKATFMALTTRDGNEVVSGGFDLQ